MLTRTSIDHGHSHGWDGSGPTTRDDGHAHGVSDPSSGKTDPSGSGRMKHTHDLPKRGPRKTREFGSMDLGLGLAGGAMAGGVLLSAGVVTGAVEGPVADGINAISPLWEHSPALAAMVLTVGGFLAFLWKAVKLLQAERTAADVREEQREMRTLAAFEKMHGAQIAVQERVANALGELKARV